MSPRWGLPLGIVVSAFFYLENSTMSLKKLIPLYILMMPISVLANDIYLKGISIIGQQKTAYISLSEDNSIAVVEGKSIGSWIVERIAGRSVFLRHAESDEIIELALHSRLSVEQPVPESTTPKAVLEQIAKAVAEGQTVIAPPPPEKVAEGVYRGKPHLIAGKDVPPGYYRKRTPFGDYLIKGDAQ